MPFPNQGKLVPVFSRLNFLKNEIPNFETARAYAVRMISPHRLLVLHQLDDRRLTQFLQFG
jgi:hypothetical protein